MKRVNKKAVIEKVVSEKTWEFFSHQNAYAGGEFGKATHPSHVIEDIQLGHAVMFEDNGRYVLKFAGRCKWVSQ